MKKIYNRVVTNYAAYASMFLKLSLAPPSFIRGSPHLVAQHIFIQNPLPDATTNGFGVASGRESFTCWVNSTKSNNINMTIHVCALTLLLLGVKL